MGDRVPALEVEGLSVDYRSVRRPWVNIVNRVSLTVAAGEILGLAGESGCGKSTVASVVMGERPAGRRVREGRVRVAGTDILALDGAALQPIRGRRMALVPQNPTQSLTPSMRVGRQVAEILEVHGLARGRAADRRAEALLAEVGLPDPPVTAAKLPHQLSGGQQQRVVLAMALACRPALVVLDEPTTGLDVTTQARILDLLADLRSRFDVAMLYISHDLAALAQVCDRIAVMYAGEVVETSPAAELFYRPLHPYTRGLIASVPQLDRAPDAARALAGTLQRDRLPPGCRFAPRCPAAEAPCFEAPQRLEAAGPGHAVACRRWRALEAAA
jgi:peptide/nickel transport system ATP-binding protein